jgi:hypothetical protein
MEYAYIMKAKESKWIGFKQQLSLDQ